MASLNKVLLIGNLTRDPELRYTPNGTAICQFSLAVNRRFKSANGAEKNETCYLDVLVWGAQGENAERFLKKGSPVFVEGRLQMDQWDDKESGQRRTKLQIIAETVQFLSARSDDQAASGSYDAPPQQQSAPRPNYAPRQNAPRPPVQNAASDPGMPEAPMQDPFRAPSEDDIPFF